MARPRVARAAALAGALLAIGAAADPRPAGAQDLRCERGDREVRSLHFTGNRAFSNGELARVVVTTPSALLSGIGLGARRCLNPDEFPRDVLRLVAYYRKRGYRGASVDTVVRAMGGSAARPRVAVTFAIHEGTPVRIDSLAVVGLADVRPGPRTRARAAIRLRPGDVFDLVSLEAGRDTLRDLLRNGGYPDADALLAYNTDTTRLRAAVTVTVVPGAFTRVGRIVVRGTGPDGGAPHIPDRIVRSTLGVRTGDPVRLNDLFEAQRTLYQTDAYRRVDVRLDTTSRRTAPNGATTEDLLVTADEGPLRSAEASAGWATLDCFRLRTDLTDRYFIPQAQRLELSGRLSRIGVGHPLAFAPGLCAPPARSDAYGDTVNYYVGATVRQPSFFRLRRVPSVTLFTSRASEYNAFERVTPLGALFSLASRPGSRLPSTFTYQLERGRTTANAAVFCAVFSACDDPTRSALDRNRTVGTLGYALVRNRANDLLNPTSGNVERLTLRHSSALTGSEATQRFNKGVLDGTYYHTIAGGGVFTAHVQGGALLGDSPQQERLFAGGPTTVRGYRQNELGPQVYLLTNVIADTAPGGVVRYRAAPGAGPERTIPAGGNTLFVGNLEMQLRSPVLPELLAVALFTDAGEVFNRGSGGDNATAGARNLRVTPGAGVRVRSPFGAIRVDLGYNPYAATAGPAYYITPGDTRTQVLYCVSPGSAGGVVGVAGSSGSSCPPTYRPPSGGSFLRRLNPSIWIGQAF
ncbi:MAG TPA: BamA/TamA family outer membrane protein [Gemmatirosa sp.]